MTNPARSNSLTDLAHRIKAEHQAVVGTVRRSLEHAIAAGELLAEAKGLLRHGQWMAWVKKYCGIPHRTVNLYLRLASHKEQIGNVANLSIRDAIKLLQESSAIDGTDGHHYHVTPPALMAKLDS